MDQIVRVQHAITFSQFGEDITSQHILRNLEDGFYVDIGAHHPTRHSNTAALHLRGWNGVNVEPSKENFDAFTAQRPHAINVHAAVHNTDETVTLHTFERGLVNTVLANRAENLSADHKVTGTEVVPAYSLNQIFEKFVPEGTQVNYMTIDIEGYDRQAMEAFDVERYRPDVLCVELFNADLIAIGEDPMAARLIEAGYQPYSVNIFSFTFVNVRAADRLQNGRVRNLARLARSRRERAAADGAGA